jgi:hypothetical protein
MIISFEVLDFLSLQWSLRSLAERDEMQVALKSPSDFFKLRHARSNAGQGLFTDRVFNFRDTSCILIYCTCGWFDRLFETIAAKIRVYDLPLRVRCHCNNSLQQLPHDAVSTRTPERHKQPHIYGYSTSQHLGFCMGNITPPTERRQRWCNTEKLFNCELLHMQKNAKRAEMMEKKREGKMQNAQAPPNPSNSTPSIPHPRPWACSRPWLASCCRPAQTCPLVL